MDITKLNVFPLILIDDIIYTGNLSIPSFARFVCHKNILDCKGFDQQKNFFLILIVSVSSVLLVAAIWLCAVCIKEKYEREMKIRFEQEMSNYRKVAIENQENGIERFTDEIDQRLDASLVSDTQSVDESQNVVGEVAPERQVKETEEDSVIETEIENK